MRFGRHVITLLVLVFTLSALGAPRDTPRDEPRFAKRFIRIVKSIIQPLGDYVSPPHP